MVDERMSAANYFESIKRHLRLNLDHMAKNHVSCMGEGGRGG